LPWMKRTLTISLDFDWFWRVFALRIGTAVYNRLSVSGGALEAAALDKLTRFSAFSRRHLGVGESEASRGIFARTWPIGTTTLWIAVLLTAYLLVYYL
jgi:multicomponent Na+:H+ antiporter subunit D